MASGLVQWWLFPHGDRQKEKRPWLWDPLPKESTVPLAGRKYLKPEPMKNIPDSKHGI